MEKGNNSIAAELNFQVDNLSLSVRLHSQEPTLALVGPSGSGKSTLLRALAGLGRRADGKIIFRNVVWQDSSESVFVAPWDRRIGYVPQDSLLFPNLNVIENLLYGKTSSSAESPIALREVTAALNINDLLSRQVRLLSGGERQRVALGRALLSNPDLLLLDEPFSAMDRRLRSDVAAFLNSWRDKAGAQMILVSHDEADAAALQSQTWEITSGFLRLVH